MNQQTQEFFERVIFGKVVSGKNLGEAIKICSAKAVNDASRPFTSSTTDKKIKEEIAKAKKDAVNQTLTNCVIDLQSCQSQSDFRQLHKRLVYDMSKQLRSKLNPYENVINKPYCWDSLGFIQKVINLTYKYLYATGYLTDPDVKFLDVAIDNIIKTKINSDFNDLYNNKFTDIPWSQIPLEKYPNYRELQEELRQEVSQDTTFEWEMDEFNHS